MNIQHLQRYYTCPSCSIVNVVFTKQEVVTVKDIDKCQRSSVVDLPVKGSVCMRCEAEILVVWNGSMCIPYKNIEDFKNKLFYFPGSYGEFNV